jgi:hypothetical protein
MRISRWTSLWLLVVAVLVVTEVAIVLGLLNPNDLVANFFLFVFALAIVAVLAIVGAVFVGIFLTHRVLATQAFTPFEMEMLRMREDVRDALDRIEALDRKVSRLVDADPDEEDD